jgi:hypothetical protein
MSLRPGPPASPEQWPTVVVGVAAARVDGVREWLAARPAIDARDPAVRVAATLLLCELDVVASHLRMTTTHALAQLDEVSRTLAEVNAAAAAHAPALPESP